MREFICDNIQLGITYGASAYIGFLAGRIAMEDPILFEFNESFVISEIDINRLIQIMLYYVIGAGIMLLPPIENNKRIKVVSCYSAFYVSRLLFAITENKSNLFISDDCENKIGLCQN